MDLYDDGYGNLIYLADDDQWYYYDDYAAMYGDTEGVYATDVGTDYSADDTAPDAPSYAPQAPSFWQQLGNATYSALLDPNDPTSVVGFGKQALPIIETGATLIAPFL